MGSSLNDLIYGALLHDIGKIFFKAGRGSNHINAGLKAATDLFAGRTLPKITKDAIAYHHAKDLKRHKKEVAPETWLIYEADNIAAGLDRREKSDIAEIDPEIKHNFEKTIPLKSVFNLLNEGLNGEPDDISDSFKWGYPLRMLGGETNTSEPIALYPYNKDDSYFKATKDKYEEIARKWDREVKENQEILTENPNALILLMESLLSFAPSDTFNGRISDISLYEHLRITAAIASCMYLQATENEVEFKSRGDWENEEIKEKHRNLDQFLLVGADVSGVQKFIYNITSKGALKSLRARSFYLEILTEHIIDEILELCGELSRANIIFNGGGHFYLLLPNTQKVKRVLEEAQQNLNKWLWNEFRGGLSISFSYESCSAIELMDSKDKETKKREGRMIPKWEALTRKLSRQKSKKFSDLPKADFKAIFEPGETSKDSDECVISNVDHDLINFNLGTSKDPKKLCCNRLAASLHSLGRALPKAKYVWIKRHVERQEFESNLEKEFPDPIVLLPNLTNPTKFCLLTVKNAENKKTGKLATKDEEAIKNSPESRLYSLNRWVLSKYLHANLLIGNYFPDEESEEMPTFSDLANESTGVKKLGVLRADVDDLGMLFKSKLPKEVNTFSRVSVLSKHLSLFFKLYINQICAGDLDIEGIKPFRINNGLNKKRRAVVIVYAGGDDLFIVGAWNQIIELAVDIRQCFEQYTCGKLTLSAGVQVFDPKTPISQMAATVEKAEKKAKAYDNGNDKKDALCIFPNPRVLDYKTSDFTELRDRKHRDVYPWKELVNNTEANSLLRLVNTFIQDNCEIKEGRLSLGEKRGAWLNTSMMYRLNQLGEKWSEGGHIVLPQLAYLLARLEKEFKDKNNESAESRLQAVKNFLYQSCWLDENENKFKNISIQDYKTIFTWISYLTREEKREHSNY